MKEVRWLWRYEEGSINWDKIRNSLVECDVVMTAPNYVGERNDKQYLDNKYNKEFADWLANDLRFRGPTRFQMGRFQPTEILAFSNIKNQSSTKQWPMHYAAIEF